MKKLNIGGSLLMVKRNILFALALFIMGCSEIEPIPFEPSEGHISTDASPAAEKADIPELVENVPVLPEPGEPEQVERYTVVVNEVPVKELLFALARDAKVNVDIHPEITGFVTINAVEQTLPQILKRISNQIDMRYEYDGDNIYISTDTPFLRTYKIDYVNMSRDTTSANTVATQISSTSGGGGSDSGGSSTSGGGNNSTTGVTSESLNHFWETLVANITAIVGEDTSNSSANTSSVIANPESGILSVRATAKRHEEIQKFIDLSLANAKRQVLIRATIAEVQLSENYQAGVNWSLVNEATKAGINITSTALTGVPVGTLSSFVIDYVDPNTSRDQRLRATIQLLDEFGDTRILSSPQMMVLNNQTALLKVVENIVYFEINAETTPGTLGGAAVTTIDTTAQTVPVGIVMAVTPQISANGEILLNIRPTISRVTEFVNDPNPSLIVGTTTLTNPVPQIQVREMESMLRLTDGQIAVLGGLMQDQSNDFDKGLPGVKDQPGIGALFKEKTITETKTELVIFLQPYVINNPSVEDDLEQYKKYLNNSRANNVRSN